VREEDQYQHIIEQSMRCWLHKQNKNIKKQEKTIKQENSPPQKKKKQ